MNPTVPAYLVAIGASAGGVEALRELFSCVPRSLDAAYLVVLHIPPEHASHLDAVLAHTTGMPVSAAQQAETLARGHVYVATADHHLTVEDGHIALTQAPQQAHVRPSIDVLFGSVAKAASDHAIGVILSGTLTDGTQGLQGIKRAGGTALAQDPATALHGSMPANAIAQAEVDFIGSPRALATEIARLVRPQAVAPSA